MEAVDFRIEVGDRVEGGYRLTVRDQDDVYRGVAELDVAADPVLVTKLSYLRVVLQSSSAPSRRASSVEEQDVQFIGARLFRHLLVDESMGMLSRARRVARDSGRELRITLRIRPPELAVLPWEFMFDARPDRNEYLARQCLVVRDAEDAAPIPPLKVAGPLRMLAMVADVADLPRLDSDAERRRLDHALAELTGAGRLEVHWVGATKSALVSALRRGPWHVFHYIGHGEYHSGSDSGRLAFADAVGRADFVSAAQLAATLGTHPTLRLALLNACETGAGGADPHSSVATAMIHGGLPAVVGMQYPITDLVAPVFSQAFYEALADGEAVDRCVQAGRMAIWLGNAASLEWGTPVLYQRSADGRVFDIADPDAPGAAVVATAVAETPRTRAPQPSQPSQVTEITAVGEDVVQVVRATRSRLPEKPAEGTTDSGGAPRRLRVLETGSLPLGMAFHGNESILAVACQAQQIRVANLRDPDADWSVPAPPSQFSRMQLALTSVYFDPRGYRLHALYRATRDLGALIGSNTFDFRWSVKDHRYIGDDRDVRLVVHDLATGGKPLQVLGRDTSRIERGEVVYERGRRAELGDVRYAALSPEHVAAVAGNGRVLLWRTGSGKFVRELAAGLGPVALTAEGREVIWGDEEHRLLTITDVTSGQRVGLWPISGPNTWAHHRSGRLFRQMGPGKSGRLLHTDSPEDYVDVPYPAPGADAASPVFSPSGRYLAFPASDSAVEIWDLAPGTASPAPTGAPSPASGA